MKMTKKLLSGILTVSMLISMLPMSISAACNHHTTHDAICGFAAEVPCVHVGDGAVHDGTCGFVAGHDCEHKHSDALCGANGEKCSHKHGNSCKYVEAKPCTHTHDEACGYVAEKTCTFDPANCEKCKEEQAKAEYPNSPVYIIKSGEGSFILNVYQNGKMIQTETKDSNGLYRPMKFVDNANYAPFRYLFEEFGLAEANADLCTASNPEELKAFDMSEIPIPEGKTGVYIALYNYGDGKDRRIEIDGTKRIVLLVKLAVNPTDKVILVEGQDLKDSKDRPIYDENGNKVTGQVKILENSTYIPLRALQLCNMHVSYDANAKAAYIFPKSVEYTAKEQEVLKGISQAEKITPVALDGADKSLFDKATEAYNGLLSNSYVNYSKAYKKADGSVSVIDGAYAVNQVGDYLVYVNKDLKLSVSKRNDKGVLETFPVDANEVYPCDSVIFDGYNVYGIKAKNADATSGKVFVAKLTRTAEGYKLIEYKEVPGIASAHALCLDGNKLYFIDDDENCKIKSVSTSGAKETIATVAEDPGKEIFAFAVYNGNIFYDNNNDKSYLNGTVFQNANGMYVREVVANQDFNGTEGDMFYYTLETGDANYLYAIRKEKDGSIASVLVECESNGIRLRNLTMIDGAVYATTNGNLIKLK